MAVIDLSSLSIFLATRAQTLESRRRTYIEWARGLSMEDYLRRDEMLETAPCAEDGAWVTWVLAPRDQPETLEFYSSCETFRRKGVVARPSNSEAEAVIAYGVASVFTPPQIRGKGYAQHMMRLLHWVLSNAEHRSRQTFPGIWGAPPIIPEGFGNALWSVLYSDVGPSFYTKCGMKDEPRGGWAIQNPQSTVWDVESWIEASSSRNWEKLDRQLVETIWLEDSAEMSRELMQGAIETNSTTLSFLPSYGLGGFQIDRLINLGTGRLPAQVWGVRLLGHEDLESNNASVHLKGRKMNFATWTLELTGTAITTLVITRLRCPQEKLGELLEQVAQAAREIGVTKLEVWNIPKALEKEAEKLGGRTNTRENHLPSLKWYEEGEPEWMFNERFCWC